MPQSPGEVRDLEGMHRPKKATHTSTSSAREDVRMPPGIDGNLEAWGKAFEFGNSGREQLQHHVAMGRMHAHVLEGLP
ncbi:hypothetical protein K3495_g8270 [Podosphaera aphanis]|nr:hypothetical protein K3495_g8270 [Podosphaera aphanis]